MSVTPTHSPLDSNGRRVGWEEYLQIVQKHNAGLGESMQKWAAQLERAEAATGARFVVRLEDPDVFQDGRRV